ncbi:hypothetical protein GCM10023185_11680 [Hymenobacter saemangeumensis]|uniref:Ig-like domain-containing protein n=1 Tax=Hymenobacter saemangeumensis TaxID=1084522 RepID=A0ABP8I664_9BACT
MHKLLLARHTPPPPIPSSGKAVRWLRALPVLAFLLLLGQGRAWAQVTTYSFSQSSGTYTAIMGTSLNGSTFTADDVNYTLAAGTIPFTFTFNGTGYTGLTVNTNGYITFGANPPATNLYTPISATTGYAGAISALGFDQQGLATGQMTYATVGTAPNRAFVIQWADWRSWNSTGENYNYQIRLNENNTIDIVYGAFTVGATARTPQVGLRGATNADYNNRTSTTSWASTTAGGSNAATVTLSSTVFPASGLTYTYAQTPQSYASNAIARINTGVGVAAGSTNQAILRLAVNTTGAGSPQLALTALTANTNNTTNPANISNARLYYTGTSASFSTATLLATVANPSGQYSFTGFTQTLTSASTHYFFIAYDIAPGAPVGNEVSGDIVSFVLGGTTQLAGTTTPAAGTRPIAGLLAGNYTINNAIATGGTNFNSFSEAITALNTGSPTSAVTFTVADGQTFTELPGAAPQNTGTRTGMPPAILVTGTAAAPIVFQRSNTGASAPMLQVTGTAGALDAAITLVGSDYVTFNGINISQPAGNTSLEYGFAFFRGANNDGCQNNTIRNSTITLDRTANVNSAGVFSSAGGIDLGASPATTATVALTSATAASSNNRFYNLTIANVNQGIVLAGFSAAFPDLGNDVGGAGAMAATTGNSITNFASNGINASLQDGARFNNNTINNAGGAAAAAALAGINITAATTGNVTAQFNTITLAQASSNATYGIFNSNAGAAASSTTITNNTVSVTVNVAGTALSGATSGIHSTGANGSISLSNNTVSLTVAATGAVNFTGVTYGVFNSGASATTLALNSNTVSYATSASSTGGAAHTLGGVYNTGAATGAATMNGNSFAWSRSGAGTGPATGLLYALYNTGIHTGGITISNNTWGTATPTTISTAGNTSTGYFIFNSNSTPNVTVSNNTVQNLARPGTGPFYGYYNFGSPGSGTQTLSNNTVTGIDISTGSNGVIGGGTGTGALYGLYTNTSTNQTQVFTGNMVNNLTAGTGLLYGIFAASTSATSTINNNTISTLQNFGGTSVMAGIWAPSGASQVQGNNVNNLFQSGTGATYGISTASAGVISGNTIDQINSGGLTGTTGVFGLQGTGAATSVTANTITNITGMGTSPVTGLATAAIGNVFSNDVRLVYSLSFTNGMTTTAGSGPVYGLFLNGGTGTTNVYSHSVYDLMANTGTVHGIYANNGAGNTLNIRQNKVYGLGLSGATGTIYGLFVNGVSTTAVVNAFNNLIGLNGRTVTDIAGTGSNSAFATGGASVVNGVGVGGATASTANISFNTVYLANSSSATNFGSSALFVTTATPIVNLRSNIFYNTMAPAGTGIRIAYRRSAAPTNTNAPAATNNGNLYYAATPSASNLLYGEGTATVANGQQTLAAMRSYFSGTSGGEQTSKSDVVVFVNTSDGSLGNYLHIDTTAPTQVESGGVTVAGITTDYDNDTRNASTPDIGADEGNFVPKDVTAPNITYTVLGNTANTTSRTLVVNITDASNVASGPNAPRLYFRKGTMGAFQFVNASSFTSTSTPADNNGNYTFTFNYALVGGVTAGDVVQYYVAAQDNVTPVANGGSNPAGSVSINPPGAVFTGTPNSFTILPTLAGNYYVGTTMGPYGTPAYATLTAAAAAYNMAGMGGAVNFILVDGTYTGETYPITFNNNGDASSTNVLTIKPYTGITPVFTNTTASSSIVLNGSRFIVLDGSNTAGGTTRDWTLAITNTGATSPIVMVQSGAIAAANNVVRHMNLTGQAATSTRWGIRMLNSATTGASNNSFINNAITRVQEGIAINGNSDTVRDTGTLISNNQVGSATVAFGGATAIGISATNQTGITITGNTVRNANVTVATLIGIDLNSNVGTATVRFNTVRDLITSGGSSSSSPLAGIRLNTNTTGAVVDANTVFNIKTTSTGGWGGYGIYVNTATASTNNRISNNVITDVNGSNWSSFTGSSSAGIYLNSTQSGISIVFNTVNMFGNSSSSSSATITAALAVESGSTGLTVVNNILANGIVHSTAGALPFSLYSSAPASAYTLINKNDYFSYGSQAPASGVQVRIGGTNHTTLTDVRAATGQDVGSVSVDPSFSQPNSAPYDLTPSALALNNTAQTGTGVTTDYSGAPRSATPDFGAIEFAPLLIDVRPTVLVNPATTGCYSSTQSITVRLNNNALGTHDFTENPTTITVTVTLPNMTTQTLTTTVSSNAGNPGGTPLASTGSVDIVLPGSFNMSASGTYSFAIATETLDDQNTNNDNLTVTRTVGPQATLPQAVNFTGYTGTDANLSTLFPGWREATGLVTPVLGESTITSRNYANDAASPNGTSASLNIWSSTVNQGHWIVSPRLTGITATSILTYDVAHTAFSGTAAGTLDSDDLVQVRISTDCGQTFTALRTYNAANQIAGAGQTETVSLSAYAGQQIILGFFISEGATATDDTNVYFDNIDVRVPTTVDLSATGLFAPASTATCYANAETVTAIVTNASNTTALNFATTPATVTVTVTLPNMTTQTLTATVNTGTLAPSASQNVVLPGTLNMSALGTYSFAVSATVTGDQNTANDLLTPSPTRTVVAPTAGAVSPTTQNICNNTSATLAVDGTANGTIQWQVSTTSATTGFSDVAGANSASFTTAALSPGTYYFRAQVRCGTRTATSTNVGTVIVENPTLASAPTTNPASGTVCEGNTVTISATKQASQTGVRFYNVATGGTPLTGVTNVGNTYSYTTPILMAGSPTYYVAAVSGSAETVGRSAPAATSNISASNYGLVFNAQSAFTLTSVDIYPAAAAGTVTIQVQDNTGTLIPGLSGTYSYPAGAGTTPYTVNLGYNVPAGTGLRLIATTSTTALVRESAIGGYPYNSPSGNVSITSGYISGTTTTYYYFYNWQIGAQCEGTRTAVPLTVTPAPAFSISPSMPQTVCAGQSVNVTGTFNPADYNTFTYTANTSAAVAGISQASTSSPTATLTPTATTTYTVTASNSMSGPGGCQAIRTLTINVNPVSVVTLTASPATTCVNSSTQLTAANAADIAALKITEFAAFAQGGTGQTPTYPSYVGSSEDLLEISNTAGYAINAGGLVVEAYQGTALDRTFTIPAGTMIPAASVMVIKLGTGTDSPADRYFNTGGANDAFFSSTAAGFVLKTSTGAVVDAVAMNSYTFPAASGVSASDFTGNIPSSSGFAGIIRTNPADTNAASDFSVSSATLTQSIGTYNGGYTSGSAGFTYSYSSPNGGTFSNATAQNPTFSATTAGSYPITVTTTNSATGCQSTASFTVTVTNVTTWTGAASTGSTTNWFNAGNWTNCVPDANISAIIPTGLTNYPNLTTGMAVANNLTVQGTGVVNISNAAATLDLKGNLTTAGMSSINATAGTMTFTGTAAQSIGSGQFFNVVLNSAATDLLGGDIRVAGNFDLTNGMLNSNGFELRMNSTSGSFIGTSTTHYVVITGAGRVRFDNVGSGGRASVTFPIGTTTFNPATLTNTGTLDFFTAGVATGISRQGNAVTNNVVNRTWSISEGVAGGSVSALTLQWNTADEMTGFNRGNAAVVQYLNNAWNAQCYVCYGPASGSNPFTLLRSGLTSFGNFGVQDATMPLPVELSRFTAQREGKDALLDWATASEKNNLGFDVQVSTDGRSFRSLGFVASATANSTAPRSYRFLDTEKNKAGVRYYRLRQVDTDGTASFSMVRTVAFDGSLSLAAGLTASPNPFTSELTLTVTATKADAAAQLTVTDAAGRVVLERKLSIEAGTNEVSLPGLDNLPDGMYLLHLPLDGQLQHVKVVKK